MRSGVKTSQPKWIGRELGSGEDPGGNHKGTMNQWRLCRNLRGTTSGNLV